MYILKLVFLYGNLFSVYFYIATVLCDSVRSSNFLASFIKQVFMSVLKNTVPQVFILSLKTKAFNYLLCIITCILKPHSLNRFICLFKSFLFLGSLFLQVSTQNQSLSLLGILQRHIFPFLFTQPKNSYNLSISLLHSF